MISMQYNRFSVIKLLTEQVDTYSMELLSEKETTSIANAINRFLESISLENRIIFIRRYCFCDTHAEIAARYGISERKVRRQIQGIRDHMCEYLGQAWGSFGINHVDIKFLREAEEVTSLRERKIFLCEYRSTISDVINYLLGRFLSFPEHA